MEQLYPKHLYEPIRREVAGSFIRRELKKYLPSIKDSDQWMGIRKDIDDWFSDSPSMYPVRDFWNGVHGIVMGFKLITHLTEFITAKNIEWTKEEVEIGDLHVPFADKEKAINDPDEPIIVTQKKIDGKDRLSVYDGNNRVNRAMSEGKMTLVAYVGRFIDDSRVPKNYWLPTSILMDINSYAKRAYDSGNMALYKNYVAILFDMLQYSESGRYEMRNRVIPKDSEYRKRILTDLELA